MRQRLKILIRIVTGGKCFIDAERTMFRQTVLLLEDNQGRVLSDIEGSFETMGEHDPDSRPKGDSWSKGIISDGW